MSDPTTLPMPVTMAGKALELSRWATEVHCTIKGRVGLSYGERPRDPVFGCEWIIEVAQALHQQLLEDSGYLRQPLLEDSGYEA